MAVRRRLEGGLVGGALGGIFSRMIEFVGFSAGYSHSCDSGWYTDGKCSTGGLIGVSPEEGNECIREHG